MGSEPGRDASIGDAMDQSTGPLNSPKKENGASPTDSERQSSIKASPSSAMPSRNSPLSWQQRRPPSEASERPRSRPLSMVAAENAARSPRATPEPQLASAAEPALSRDQIAQTLASKDPAWFRQSAESREGRSPAYRKNQVEEEDRSDHGLISARVQMPGMSREAAKPAQAAEESTDQASSPAKSSLRLGNGSRSAGIGSPVPLTSAQRFEPPNIDSMSESRGLAMSPSQGRISPDRLNRPASPTKGMGGFVQSAMMKRSDSVSKRWSVQSPPGLSRGNSIASNRSSYDPNAPLGNLTNSSVAGPRPTSPSRDGSPRPLSRPTSSHSNATVTQDGRPGTASSMRSSVTTSTNDDVFIKPALPASRSQTPQDATLGPDRTPETDIPVKNETTPPTSPSKTMDPRRWSPTKSSWLDSALNKPESPKPKPTPPPQQPAWMSEITKAKQKASVDLGRGPTNLPKHEVSIGGLMRSPPPGGINKPIGIGGMPLGFSTGVISKGTPESIGSQVSKVSPGKVPLKETMSLPPLASIKSSPASGKNKPETPLKKDFRANLKPRQLPVESKNEQPEFKNVFGQLRRTKTQNYVAPDELKDNITRGKAALNLTGGPKKTERKDDFKDAIMKKKEDFKKAQLDGKGVTRSTSGGSQDSPLPEALAKRKVLGRSDSNKDIEPSSSLPVSAEPAVQESPKSSLPSQDNTAPGRVQGKDAISGKLAGRFNPALAGLLARGPPSAASETSRSSSLVSSQRTVSMSTSTTNPDTAESGPQLTHMTKARARGPRRKAPSTAPTTATLTDLSIASKTPVSALKPATSSPKIHSPIKALNTVDTAEKLPSPEDSENQVPQPSSPRNLDLKRRSQFLQEVPNKSNKGEPILDPPKPLSPIKKANAFEIPVKVVEAVSDTVPSPKTKAKPSTPVKSPSLSSKSKEKPAVREQIESPETAKLRPYPLSPKKLAATTVLPVKDQPVSPAKLPAVEKQLPPANSKEPETVVSVRNAAAQWDRPSSIRTSNPARTRSPIKLPTHDDEKAAMIGAGLRSASPSKSSGPIGLALNTTKDFASSRPFPIPPSKGPLSPPSSAGLVASSASTKSNDSPIPQTSEASRLVAGFFGHYGLPPEFTADTAAILSARPEEGLGVKTLRSNLYQLSADGKKQPVPNHQERLLFEENMYICVHAFGNAAGKKVTEIYFWSGDEVSAPTVSGAIVFAEREAKSAGARLIMIRQGKETPEFFQALGGIIVIRRGTSNKYDSLAPHILCGRQQFGQIAFDEVDYSPSSLCSGFPFLISTPSGKSYLWKGKGSGIDELSCARLIGMDFGLTGEIEEIDEGNETVSFLQIFGAGAKIPKSADHWRMKPNYSKYCSRLFCADSTSESQVSVAKKTRPSTLVLN
jgi:hypothetical protein